MIGMVLYFEFVIFILQIAILIAIVRIQTDNISGSLELIQDKLDEILGVGIDEE